MQKLKIVILTALLTLTAGAFAGWSGSGSFTRTHDWTDDAAAAIPITASRMDAEDDNFATGINACLAKNGENAATGNLNIGGYRLTAVGAGAAATDACTIGGTETLTNKTLTAPVLGGTVTGTYTLGGTPTIDLGSITSSGDLPVTQGGTGASTAADARTNLGLGTAAVATIGTSGDTVPKNNTANTFSADQTIQTSGNSQLTIAGDASGNVASLLLKTGASTRWLLQKNATAETGSNAGSDLALYRYNDDGVSNSLVLSINRNTGAASYTGAFGASGSITENSSRVFSGNSKYESADTAVPAVNTDTTVSHGLSGVPRIYRVVLRCTNANLGYAVGDQVDVTAANDGDGGRGAVTWANATTIGFRRAADIYLPDRSGTATSAITTSSWRLVFYAWY